MDRLELVEIVQRLANIFRELLEDVIHNLAWRQGPWSEEYLITRRDMYNEAIHACKLFLNNDSCRQCLLSKLRSLELDDYAFILDFE